MCMCICVCVYVYLWICVYMSMCICICVCMCMRRCLCTSISIYSCVCICICRCIWLYMYVYVRTYAVNWCKWVNLNLNRPLLPEILFRWIHWNISTQEWISPTNMEISPTAITFTMLVLHWIERFASVGGSTLSFNYIGRSSLQLSLSLAGPTEQWKHIESYPIRRWLVLNRLGSN